jgi:hypothetical protein
MSLEYFLSWNSFAVMSWVALFIMSARGVQNYLNTISTLGDQWELEVGRLVSRKGLIEHSLDRSLEIISDEILDQQSSHDLQGAVTNQPACAFVPHVDTAERINSKDGGIGRVDETSTFTLLGETIFPCSSCRVVSYQVMGIWIYIVGFS